MNKNSDIIALNNGLTIIHEQSSNASSTILELTIRVGGRDDDDQTFGMAHFVEHILANAIETRIRGFSWVGNYMLDTFEAATDQEKTTYGFAVAKEDGPEALTLIMSVFDVAITQDIIDQEKAVVTEELLGFLDEEMTPSQLHFAKVHYGDSPLGRGTALGTLQIIESFTFQNVVDYLKRYYHRSQAYLTVTGSFDLPTLTELLESGPRTVTESVAESKPAASPDPKTAGLLSFFKQSGRQNRIIFAGKHTVDTPGQAVELMVLMGLLQQYLEYEGRRQQLFYGLSASYSAYRDHVDVVIESQCESSKTVEYCKWLFETLRNFENQLTTDIVAAYKANLVKQTRLSMHDPKVMLDNLAWYYYYFGQVVSNEFEIELIKNIEVENIRQRYIRLLTENLSTLVVAGSTTNVTRGEIKSLKDGFTL